MEYINFWSWSTYFFYLLILILSIIFLLHYRFSFSNIQFSNSKSQKGLFFVGILWLIVLTLRDSSRGVDVVRYFRIYSKTNYNAIKDVFVQFLSREPLDGMIEFILKQLNVNVNERIGSMVYLGVFAMLWIIFVLLAIKEESKTNGIIVATAIAYSMFFFRGFSMLRQSISMAIMLYAFTQLAKGEKKKYWILQLISIGFHYSAIICIAAYFFWPTSKKNNIKDVIFRILIIGLIFLLMMYGSRFFSVLFSGTNSKYELLSQRSSKFGVGQLLMRLPMLILVLFNREKLIKQNEHNRGYISLLILDVIVAQLNYVSPSFSRASLYFSNLYIFIIPSFISCIKLKYGKHFEILVSVILIFLFLTYKIYYFVYTNPYYIMPYLFS